MNPVEQYARSLSQQVTDNVRSASALKVSARQRALEQIFEDVEEAREAAAKVKDYVLSNLKGLLLQLETKCTENRIQVHWAVDAESARQTMLSICEGAKVQERTIVKAKSMATEEIHLNPFLEDHGYQPIETDLGEFVVQLDHDTPSHIVTPIIHKTRQDVSLTFSKVGLGPRSENAEELAMQARDHLRSAFSRAEIGISGVNFAIAESGRLVLIENEGNNRLSTTAPRIHIALMGIEKILPRDADLALFLPLLSGSATGQHLTSYVHLIQGPSGYDGPEEVHLVLLDNGRSRVLSGEYRDVLRCIRCGACLNVCPVYRQTSGHAYGHVYSGPIGAVLAPALEGVERYGKLAKASTLCGACQEACPVKIPLPEMLLRLRDESERAGVLDRQPLWGAFRFGAIHPTLWRAGLVMLPMVEKIGGKSMRDWTDTRELPQREGDSFRGWWHDRQR